MKVICIDDSDQLPPEPMVKKGHVYTVVEENRRKRRQTKDWVCPAGIFYTLIEMGGDVEFYYKRFVKVIEDQQDEKEFERNYNKQVVKNQ